MKLGGISAKELTDFLFDKSVIGIVVTDIDGSIVTTNKVIQDILGYTKDELETMQFQHITHPDDMIPTMQVHNALISGKTERMSVVKRYIDRKGDSHWAKVTVRTLKEETTGEIGYLVVYIIPLGAARRDEVTQILERRTFCAHKYAKVALGLILLIFLLLVSMNVVLALEFLKGHV